MARIAQERVEVLRQANNTQLGRVDSEYIEYITYPPNTQFARMCDMYIEIMYLPGPAGAVWNPFVCG